MFVRHSRLWTWLLLAAGAGLLLAALGYGCGDPTPKELNRFALSSVVSCFAPSPDGKLLAVAQADVIVLKLDTGIELARIPQGCNLNAMAFSPDGKLLAVACGLPIVFGEDEPGRRKGAVKLYDAITFKEKAILRFPDGVQVMAFSPNSSLLAVGTEGGRDEDRHGTVKLFETEPLRERATLQKDAVYPALAFAPDGKIIAVADTRGVGDLVRSHVVLYDAASAQRKGTFQVQNDLISRMAYFADGETLAVFGRAGLLKLWTVADGTERSAPDLAGGYGGSGHIGLALSPNGKTLAVCGAQWTGSVDSRALITLWDVDQGKVIVRWQDKGVAYKSLAFVPDGSALVGGGWQPGPNHGIVKIWAMPAQSE